ncbi:MAG: GNAT family N-acetyltransferase [Saprospiraceae bacterium]
MTGSLVIRAAELPDLATLTQLSTDTFFETYAAYNEKASMDRHLAEKFNLQQMASELSDAQNQFFLASVDGHPAGYTKLRTSKILVELEGKNAIEIERIYVLKSFQGKKIGAALIQHSIDLASINGFDTIWLGVWTENPKAINFYTQWGFEIFGTHIFYFGDDPQTDYLMKKELV